MAKLSKKRNEKINKMVLHAFTIVIFLGFFIKSQERLFFYLNSKQVNSVFASSFVSTKSQVLSTNEELEYGRISGKLELMTVDQAKVSKIRRYLASRGAPLASEAEYFVKTADQFGLDYRLVAAISIIESSGGKRCYRPYNAWGWGGSVIPYSFKNWKEGIYTVSKGLSKYYSSGLVTPQQIAPRYNPNTPNEWSSKVSYVMSQM